MTYDKSFKHPNILTFKHKRKENENIRLRRQYVFQGSSRRSVGMVPLKADNRPRAQDGKSRWDLNVRYLEKFIADG